MNDDRMDEMLIEGVRDYNAPRGVPREEMWKRIEATRADQRRRAVPVSRQAGRWVGVGIAATLILSAGVAIGLRMGAGRVPAQSTVAVAKPGQSSAAATPHENAAPEVASSPAKEVASAASSPAPARDTLIEQIRAATQSTGRRARELASAPAVTGSRTPRPQEQSMAYQLVVLQHLAGSEAMITSFRSGARNGQMDAQLSAWSKELLSTTRLLEASQGSSDPVMKRLLEDLDLVISQIVQYTTNGTSNPEELDLIEQSINKRGVMTKLRSNPLRTVSAGT